MLTDGKQAPDKLYRIRSEDGYNFIAGHSGKGEQVLLGVHERRLVGVFFQPEGDFIGVEDRPQPPEEVAALSELDAELALWPRLEAWKAEVGFTPCDIQVKAFLVFPLEVGIYDMPLSYQTFLDNPLSFRDEETRTTIRDAIADWRATGRFILWWRKEYWMNAQGEVTDT